MVAFDCHIPLVDHRQTRQHHPILQPPKNHPTGTLPTINIHGTLGRVLGLASSPRLQIGRTITIILSVKGRHDNIDESRRLRVT